ncbi:MAG TPA: fluoride efflux transporter CrcB [Bacteroidia bacterium]|nr:fluoride efflux transporter CrcB [Bacteroidia bacterium]QQR94750.1 MAG: fluoride efflux transporter CrcB [Bacteroidota bacterium]HRB96894.1 fluoride efflux transporter CrcB [Nitrosomonas sp.]MBP7715229.1 fluoride efflux transporter CrcB [Bacteroidia bacterium]MBP8669389.1 fluoride efflux transporter CrcB [Bacteroidia bacterium]
MRTILTIGFGSFIGGMIRYMLSLFIQSKTVSEFPVGTLLVNIIGCFLIGVVYSFAEQGKMAVEWRLFIATGILGGFTTFSAFSMESFMMLRNGYYGMMTVYVFLSLAIGISATIGGFLLVRTLN